MIQTPQRLQELLEMARQTIQSKDRTIAERDAEILNLRGELGKVWNVVRDTRNELDVTKQKLADAVLRARPARSW
jgi:hypothetical protein